MCLSTTFIMSLATVVILFCIERPLVAGYQKIKQNEGTKYEVKICKSPSDVEYILNYICRKKRKRVLTGRFFYVYSELRMKWKLHIQFTRLWPLYSVFVQIRIFYNLQKKHEVFFENLPSHMLQIIHCFMKNAA